MSVYLAPPRLGFLPKSSCLSHFPEASKLHSFNEKPMEGDINNTPRRCWESWNLYSPLERLRIVCWLRTMIVSGKQ